MAAGSRAKMRQRMRVSCQSGYWRSVVRGIGPILVAQMAAGQVDEHVFEGGVVRREAGQGTASALKMSEQEWEGFVQLLDGERKPFTAPSNGMNPRQSTHAAFLHRSIARELDHFGSAEQLDEFARATQRDDLALIDYGHPVAEPLRFVHVMCSEQHCAALGAKPFD